MYRQSARKPKIWLTIQCAAIWLCCDAHRFQLTSTFQHGRQQGCFQGMTSSSAICIMLFKFCPCAATIPRVVDLRPWQGIATAKMLGVLGFAVCMRTFIIQDQYIELTSSIPSSATLFGLGEYTSNVGFPLRRDGIPYTLWNRDQPPAVPNTNLYGSHPIILDVRDGESMGLATCCHAKIMYSSADLFSSARHQYNSVQE